MKPAIQISAYTAVSALGYGLDAMREALRDKQSGLRKCDFENCNLDTYIGRVPELEKYPFDKEDIYSRNNRIAYAALQQDGFSEAVQACLEKYSKNRVAVILGTSTSGFNELEHAYQQNSQKLPEDFPYKQSADLFASAAFIAQQFSITGPSFTINTACSSSAKAFVSAKRLLQSGICDAVIVAGVDSLCLNILYGFHSLGLLSSEPCQACDADRRGLNIGEAAAMVLLERGDDPNCFQFLGCGESSDGYHMSAPQPEGLGLVRAMRQALQSANLKPSDIDYINMHGTASILNDIAEDRAIYTVFGDKTACSSSKGWTGHTLGAAGAVEFVLSCVLLEENLQAGCLNTRKIDPEMKSQIILENKARTLNRILSNSCGFGGNNCSLILGRSNAL